MPPTNNHMKVRLLKKLRRKAFKNIKLNMTTLGTYVLKARIEGDICYYDRYYRHFVSVNKTSAFIYEAYTLEEAKVKLAEQRRLAILSEIEGIRQRQLKAKRKYQNKQLAKI
jgi:hypothetical protein